MLVLLLDVNKMLKKFLMNMSEDNKRTTDDLKNANGEGKAFNQVRENAFHSLTVFLNETGRISSNFGHTMDFSQVDGFGKNTGLFSDTGLVRMLDAPDYKVVDQVPWFRRALADSFRRSIYNPEVAKTRTLFVELLLVINQFHSNSGWVEYEISALQSRIAIFKAIGVTVSARYKAPCMGTEKWHILDHIVEDKMYAGSFVSSIVMAAYSNGITKFSKKSYQKTSRRRKSTMD